MGRRQDAFLSCEPKRGLYREQTAITPACIPGTTAVHFFSRVNAKQTTSEIACPIQARIEYVPRTRRTPWQYRAEGHTSLCQHRAQRCTNEHHSIIYLFFTRLLPMIRSECKRVYVCMWYLVQDSGNIVARTSALCGRCTK